LHAPYFAAKPSWCVQARTLQWFSATETIEVASKLDSNAFCRFSFPQRNYGIWPFGPSEMRDFIAK
ncbi:MAG: hypothetical protein JW959_02625, partial [Pirellulales bacterium]|nr:hypothetical protein [Pirellulales bacterium]